MDVVGYVDISKDAKADDIVSAISVEKFRGETCRVFEFAEDGGALILDREATGLAMVEKAAIKRRFECGVVNDYIVPPNLNTIEQMLYVTKCMSRKGGYNGIIKQMVIQSSLMQGKFDDRFLWVMQ
jgi:hypothetical protein